MMLHPEDPGATIGGDGSVPSLHEYRLVRQVGPVDHQGEWRKPDYGPGFEEPAGDPHPSFHNLTYTDYDYGAWSEDWASGVHGYVQAHGVDAHYGYQEGWGVELPNDRAVRVAGVVPWDYGLGSPEVSAAGFRV